MDSPRSIVLVGGGTAAAYAASTLRSLGYAGRLAIVGDEAILPYQRPPLSKEVLAGADVESATAIYDRAWWESNDVDVLLGTPAVEIDVHGRRVRLDDGSTLGYDRLLLATGGRARRSRGLDSPRILTLRDRRDAQALAAHLDGARRGGGRIAILGGGFIGCEVAAQARGLGVEVTIVEMASTCLEGPLGASFGAVVTDLHRQAGVQVYLNERVLKVDEQPDCLVVHTDRRAVECTALLAAAGMDPCDELARNTPVAVAAGVLVDERGETSVPGVFAAGDVARRREADGSPALRFEHHDAAMRQGQEVAAGMLGRPPGPRSPYWFWSDQYDVRIQSLGRFDPTAPSVIRGSLEALAFSAFQIRGGVVRGVLSIGRPRDIVEARKLMASGTAVDSDAIADTGVDLRCSRRVRESR